MAGAVDVSLNIPHSVKRFSGYSAETKSFNADINSAHILGLYVAVYVRTLEKGGIKKTQFSKYIHLEL